MKKFFVVTACLTVAVLFSEGLRADDCAYEKQINKTLDLSSSDSLAVLARAGSLTINGNPDADEATITGTVCVSKEAWLDDASITTRGGSQARVEVVLPDINGGWSFTGSRYARMDLELTVPDDLKLDVKDSSGSLKIEDVGSLKLKDSSGSIVVTNVKGEVNVTDSSGSLTLNHIGGDVTIVADSSGGIYGQDIEGSVLVMKDSSGEIRFTDVRNDFTVERDSSGSIYAERIGGDFRVLKDGSGGIHATDVAGEVITPAD